jgi:hypothetical protein
VKAAKFPQLTEFYRKSEKEYRVRSSGVQEFRSSGVQEFRSSGVQEFRSSGVQEFRVGEPGELQARKVRQSTYDVQAAALLQRVRIKVS